MKLNGYLISYSIASFILFCIVIVDKVFHIPAYFFTRDIAAFAGVHPFAGALSTLGILLWCASASVCFFASVLTRKQMQFRSSLFLFSSALFTSYLALDDAFMFHESIAKTYFSVSESAIYLFIVISFIFYIIFFRGIVLRTRYRTLLFSIFLLGLSVVMDFGLPAGNLKEWKDLFEDGLKWLGIVGWCIYYTNTSFELCLKSRVGKSS